MSDVKTLYGRIRKSRCCQKVNSFFSSAWYLVFLGVFAFVTFALGIEVFTYTVFILLMLYVALFGDDLLPCVTAFAFCYISPSIENNPGRNPDSVFMTHRFGWYFIGLIALALIAVGLRMMLDKNIGFAKIKNDRFTLGWGLLALGVAYLTSGVFSTDYGTVAVKNIVFALIQFFAVAFIYFAFHFSVDWQNVRRDYVAVFCLAYGVTVFAELVYLFVTKDLIVEGKIQAEYMFTGWGISNNIGALMTVALPGCYYFAYTKNNPIPYQILGIVLTVGIFATLSRSAVIGAVAVIVVSAVFILKKGNNKKANRIFYISLGGILLVAVCFVGLWYDVFENFFVKIFRVSDRLTIYGEGLAKFWQNPIFGTTFYQTDDYAVWGWSTIEEVNAVLPGRWHNTVIQLLACTGLVGFCAYVFHRYQTVKLFMTHPTVEKNFIGLSLGVFLLMSLFDCHFFNIGPAFFYSAMLLFAEKST